MSVSAQQVLNLEHLQAELARIDLLIRREVLRWQRAGQDPNDAFRGLYVSDVEASALSMQPLGSSWGQIGELSAKEVQAYEADLRRAAQRGRSLAEQARSQGQIPRLEHLKQTFGLDPFELDTLLICLAPTLDLRYERLYSYLQNDVTRKRPTVNLALDLLCDPGPARLLMLSRFADSAPLIKYRFLEFVSEPGTDGLPLLSHTLRVDEAIVAWLLGRYQPHTEFAAYVNLIKPEDNEADVLLAAPLDGRWDHALHEGHATNELPIIALRGVDRLTQRAAARRLAAQTGRPLLAVDLAGLAGTDLSPSYAVRLVLRDALLTGAIPYLDGWDVCLKPEGAPPPELLAELCAHPDLVIVAGVSAWRVSGVDRERSLYWLETPVPAYGHRYNLWEYFRRQMASHPGIQEPEGEIDLGSLAGQFALTSGQIRDAVASATDMAAQASRPLQNEDLFAAARIHSNPHLGSLARKIELRYLWSDIVLPADQLALLREIVSTVRGRPRVLDEWGVGRKLASSSGVTVLFSGPPGTGKTMAAEIIAAELNLDLYKIDLSTVVSKYIGETEKNLEKIFAEAQSSNAILFFDEADAIFGKRSEVKDAHDRYANVEVSYLLQRMEAYDGVTILATNLRANLDEAFTRRLQFAVDFPFPDEEYRLRIWQTLFPPDVPCEPELDFDLLAGRFKLSGGSIRNIIVSAAYLAAADGGRVTMKHLLHGTRRELQKMGRLVNEAHMRVG